jgi:type I restriction enzyme S subunit
MTKSTNIQQDTDVPNGYKKTPLGVIPKEWEVKRLGDISTINSGGTPSREKAEYWGGSIPWITTSLLNYPTITFAEEFITEKGLANSSTRMLNKGTLLMAMYGEGQTRGKVSQLLIDATTNQACASIEVSNGLTDFIFYALNSKYEKIRSLSNDGGQKNLSLGLIKKIQIALPTLPEQQKIAEILSTWDMAIEKQNALIEQLELRKCGLMQQLLTGKSRLRKASGERFKGEWKKARLGKILDYEQPTPYLVKDSIYNDSFDIPVLTAGKTFILGYTNEKNGIYNKVPVIIFDDFTTDTKYVDFPFKAKSSAMKILKCKENTNIKFVYEAMQMIKYVVGGHERHWISKFAHISIPLPSLAEQTAIAEVLSTVDREIEIEKQKLAALQNQKKGLMQVLLSGKIRVKI